MPWTRTIAVVLSLMVHGSIAWAMLDHERSGPIAAFETGTGEDTVNVEQGIAIEGLSKLGDAAETIETKDVPPPVAASAPPEEVKEVDERQDAITSEASAVEDNIVKTEDPPPEDTPPPEPQIVEAQEPQQVAVVTEQSSGEERHAAVDMTARSEYLGKLRTLLEKAKINPRSRRAGTVWLRFKIGPNGELISSEIATSSGSKVLDDAAVAALARAAPFPPMPETVASGPMVVSVPFKFITR